MLKRTGWISLFIYLTLLLFSCLASEEDGASAEASEPLEVPEEKYPKYLTLVDGLHITGTPIETDIETYRLSVSGKVKKPLSLSFDDVKSMDSKRIHMDLNCPGFFTDSGYWTGISIRDLLELADIEPTARRIQFISMDGFYKKTIEIDDIQSRNILIAYAFEDEEFPVYHGYPLRVAAEGLAGNVWVKWLGEIEVW
ncbi:MAG: molybdopterin-dependent oxidoreductase [Spirochaetales bacterium]|mgnify:CR=1 FL=1|nr:molybdopterin-dependent oxidoreductase [Spirochaetales bacterium]